MNVLEKPFSFENQTIPENETLLKILNQFIKKYNIQDCFLSLSGGVDSMVLSYLLKQLFPKVSCLHLNYNNRPETLHEEEFIIKWSNLLNLDTKIYKFEITRDNTSRDDYEKITRNKRYELYREMITENSGFFLGHHANDVSENIFTNIVNGRSIFDLSVITETSNVLGVPIFRPFRDIPKTLIYDFAERYNIPYFKDTTPDWSNRGKMRRQIFPLIEDTFNPDFQNKLYELAKQSDELKEFIITKFLKPHLENIKKGKKGFKIPYSEMPLIYWKYFFQEFCHQNQMSMPKVKVVETIFQKFKSSFKIDFKKDWVLLFDNENIWILDKEYSLIWRNKNKVLTNNIFRTEIPLDYETDFLNGNIYYPQKVENFIISPKKKFQMKKIFEFQIKDVLGICDIFVFYQ